MSIRRDILESSRTLEKIREQSSDYLTDPDALALAIEGHFRGIAALAAIDGFEFLHVSEESPEDLKVVGLAYFLPTSLIPLKAGFQSENGEIAYQVRLGLDDDAWRTLTNKKRWSAVYLNATEGYEPKWNWSEPLVGVLPL